MTGDVLTGLTLTAFGVLALLVGHPLTQLVFRLVDSGSGAQDGPASTRAAGSVLRGGMWIGMLERLAVYAALLMGSVEALAVVLVVKGLGRYPELRHGDNPGIAERFIIGTFTSVLWAAACAGLATLMLSR